MRVTDFDYELPPGLIAQVPTEQRDGSRLLMLRRDDGFIAHATFRDLPAQLRPGDVLVLNDSRVLAARLRGAKSPGRGAIELLLVEENATNDWWAMLRPGRRARVGSCIQLTSPADPAPAVRATVMEKSAEGLVRLRFVGVANILGALGALGEVPLPPYIFRSPGADLAKDRERYQTVYARSDGSVAAPTAGLHFTPELLAVAHRCGVVVCYLTLHVGLGTFAPVRAASLSDHVLHEESFEISPTTAEIVNAAKTGGRRVVAVGTTTVRALESVAARNNGRVVAGRGRTRLFIHPPHDFRIVDALISNFHLPRSTLLMLVSAFASPGSTRGRDIVLAAYAEAVRRGYRFYSYGDAMLLH